MGTGEFNAWGNPVMDQHPIQGEVDTFLVASCYRNWNKLWLGGLLGLYADLAYVQIDSRFFYYCIVFMLVFSFSVLKDPGGLTDYIDAEYIPDFLGGPYEVRSLVIRNKWKELIIINF